MPAAGGDKRNFRFFHDKFNGVRSQRIIQRNQRKTVAISSMHGNDPLFSIERIEANKVLIWLQANLQEGSSGHGDDGTDLCVAFVHIRTFTILARASSEVGTVAKLLDRLPEEMNQNEEKALESVEE